VIAALAAVQEFDPSGVAARDLRECLSIQARVLGIDDPLVLRILDEQLDVLIKRDFRGVSRALGVSIEGGRGGVGRDRAARAAPGPRVRWRRARLHRPRHLRVPDRRRSPTSC
jgi:DNA-directed RNA polymerase specialized sigma54-like protein